MKLSLLLLAIIGGSTLASPITIQQEPHQKGIKADDLSVGFDRILENIDLVNLDRVVREIFLTDQGSIILLYLRGAGFGRILDAFENELEYNNILKYMAENGLPGVYDFITQLLADLGIDRPPINSSPFNLVSPQASFEELLEQLAACFDLNGLLTTALDVLNNDPATKNFLFYLSRPEVGATWQRIKVQEDLVSFLGLLELAGLDVDTVVFVIEAFFGWGPTETEPGWVSFIGFK